MCHGALAAEPAAGPAVRASLDEEISRLTARLGDDVGPAVPLAPWRRRPLVTTFAGALAVLTLLLGAMSAVGALL